MLHSPAHFAACIIHTYVCRQLTDVAIVEKFVHLRYVVSHVCGVRTYEQVSLCVYWTCSTYLDIQTGWPCLTAEGSGHFSVCTSALCYTGSSAVNYMTVCVLVPLFIDLSLCVHLAF